MLYFVINIPPFEICSSKSKIKSYTRHQIEIYGNYEYIPQHFSLNGKNKYSINI